MSHQDGGTALWLSCGGGVVVAGILRIFVGHLLVFKRQLVVIGDECILLFVSCCIGGTVQKYVVDELKWVSQVDQYGIAH